MSAAVAHRPDGYRDGLRAAAEVARRHRDTCRDMIAGPEATPFVDGIRIGGAQTANGILVKIEALIHLNPAPEPREVAEADLIRRAARAAGLREAAEVARKQADKEMAAHDIARAHGSDGSAHKVAARVVHRLADDIEALIPAEPERAEATQPTPPPLALAMTHVNFGETKVRIWQDGEWSILHIKSPAGETTTSFRSHDAYAVAHALSPGLAKQLAETQERAREAEQALWRFRNLEADPDLLDKIADEWSCGPDCDNYRREWDTGAVSCSQDDRDGCRHSEAESLRELAKAIRVRTTLSNPVDTPPPLALGQAVRKVAEQTVTLNRLIHGPGDPFQDVGEAVDELRAARDAAVAELDRWGERR